MLSIIRDNTISWDFVTKTSICLRLFLYLIMMIWFSVYFWQSHYSVELWWTNDVFCAWTAHRFAPELIWSPHPCELFSVCNIPVKKQVTYYLMWGELQSNDRKTDVISVNRDVSLLKWYLIWFGLTTHYVSYVQTNYVILKYLNKKCTWLNKPVMMNTYEKRPLNFLDFTTLNTLIKKNWLNTFDLFYHVLFLYSCFYNLSQLWESLQDEKYLNILFKKMWLYSQNINYKNVDFSPLKTSSFKMMETH